MEKKERKIGGEEVKKRRKEGKKEEKIKNTMG